ncbi:hypothetical protein GUJ93_ZPchr0001g32854 [Zizania palustris]|uniref:Uncharacterized protein n=1 Tax=Zizania palustris TaxID=103762 RepID=A0A8J5V1Y0_ZIZPA|nr:hypothetical protein GUJ93_ZPchr0001g32854 [Zizania palustris]
MRIGIGGSREQLNHMRWIVLRQPIDSPKRLQMNSFDQCLLNGDGTKELIEEWLADCSQDSEPCPPEEISSPTAAIQEVDLSGACNIVHKNSVQARSTPLKGSLKSTRQRSIQMGESNIIITRNIG